MLFKLIKTIKGKEIVDSIDNLKVINGRKKTLTNSYRGEKVTFKVITADPDEEKYRKPLTDGSWAGGDYRDKKYKIKSKIKRAKKKNS
jgi:hypothetical protein